MIAPPSPIAQIQEPFIEQLRVKDAQIAAKDAQIAELINMLLERHPSAGAGSAASGRAAARSIDQGAEEGDTR